MKKVYIVQFIGSYDRIGTTQEIGSWTKVFSSLEKAEKKYDEAMEEIISYLKNAHKPISYISLSIKVLDIDSD